MIPKTHAALRDYAAPRDASFDVSEAALASASASASRASATGGALDGLGPASIGRWLNGARGSIERSSDAQLALGLSLILFAITAWPIAMVEVPPFQDLPNHLAAVVVIDHPARYPEFVSNGFLKTNAALFGWLYFVGKAIGLKLAARLFALLVLAANALVFPRFVLELAGRRKMVVASLFCWPMIHNWFVSMGMLDFALGVPLSLTILILLERQRRAPTLLRGVAVGLVALCTWYAHVFTMMVVHLLVLVHVATRPTMRERLREARLMLVPLFPTTVLVAVSLSLHATEPVGAMTGYVALGRLLPPWELGYNLWAEWMYGFTWLSITTLVPTLALGVYGWLRRSESPTFFSPLAFATLGALYAFSPYVATNWFHVNSRIIPYLWMALLLRVPERLPKRFGVLLAVCAGLYSVGMGVDYVRLDRDRAKFTAGISAVPVGARLLPLLFKRQVTSENTRSLLHAWGYYVMEKQTSAPLLFAHSRSFPVMYASPPPPRFNHLVLESFAPSMGSPEWMCATLRASGVVVDDCDAAWRQRWAEFWKDAMPRYDHLLLWDAPPEALALVPKTYRVTMQKDRLTIFERDDTPPPALKNASL